MVEVCVVDKNDAQCHRHSGDLQNVLSTKRFLHEKKSICTDARLVESCHEFERAASLCISYPEQRTRLDFIQSFHAEENSLVQSTEVVVD
jgi:hypothetical protein